eukprot:gene3883-biopygen18849
MAPPMERPAASWRVSARQPRRRAPPGLFAPRLPSPPGHPPSPPGLPSRPGLRAQRWPPPSVFWPPPPNGTLTRIAGREAKYDDMTRGRTLSGTPSSGARSLRCRLANCAPVRAHTAHAQWSGHRGGDAEEDRSPSGEQSSSASGQRPSSSASPRLPSAAANEGFRLRLAPFALLEIFPAHSRRAQGSEGGSR